MRRGNRGKDPREWQRTCNAARRFIRALGRTAVNEDTGTLTALLALSAELDEVIGDAALALHEVAEYSWGDIGAAAGITRQAAFQRWARDAA